LAVNHRPGYNSALLQDALVAATPDSLALAQEFSRAGRWAEAEALCRQVVERFPRHAGAWRLLGQLSAQQGGWSQAVDCILRAIECSRPEALLYFDLAVALEQQGRTEAAIQAFRQVLLLEPDVAEAHYHLGRLWNERDPDKSLLHFERAAELESNHVDFLSKLAAALVARQRSPEALPIYQRLIELEPADTRVLNNLGNLLQDQGQYQAAADLYQRAIRLEPALVEAHFNRALAMSKLKRHAEAVGGYETVLKLKPDFAEAHNRLGELFLVEGRGEQATIHYQRALAIAPEHLLWRLRLDSMGKPVYSSSAEIDDYRAALETKLLDYRGRNFKLEIADLPFCGGKPPVFLAYQGRNDLRLKSLYADIFLDRIERQPLAKRSGRPSIGFVVTSGHEGVFLRGMAGVLNHMTPGRFDVTVVCHASGRDALNSQITNPAVRYLCLAAHFPQAIADLRAARLDLLYFWEIGTDSVNYFLPLFRCAPFQCTSWGWPVTSGIPQVDAFISSDLLEPPDADSHYSERLVRLAHIPNFYYRPKCLAGPDRERFGLPAGRHLYFCGQNPRKIHPDFDGLLGEILRGDPLGLVVLVEAARPAVTQLLRERFAGNLGDVLDRVRFMPRMNHAQYLQLIASADVVLDTLHYGGGANTTYDALALGMPVVTLSGEFHRGRYAATAYRTMNLEDCVAASVADYVQRAVRIAADGDYRQALCEQIRERSEVLFENCTAVGELEDFFEAAILSSRQDHPDS